MLNPRRVAALPDELPHQRERNHGNDQLRPVLLDTHIIPVSRPGTKKLLVFADKEKVHLFITVKLGGS
jgi:hypothetical protein